MESNVRREGTELKIWRRTAPARASVVTRLRIPRAVVLPRPLQHHQVPVVSGRVTRSVVPRAVVIPRPPQHLQMPTLSGGSHVHPSHGQSCSRAHRNTSRCPFLAAEVTRPLIPRAALLPRPLQHLQVSAPSASQHVFAFHGHPSSLAQVSRAIDPTNLLILSFTPTVRPAHGSLGDRSTASRHACPTRPSSARVAGSSSGSTSALNTSGRSSSSRPSSGESARAAAPRSPQSPGPQVVPAGAGGASRHDESSSARRRNRCT